MMLNLPVLSCFSLVSQLDSATYLQISNLVG